MLRTFGELVLLDDEGRADTSLRQKDLALLVYLCVSEERRHMRSVLAALLWGDVTEANARHSLTQALGRIRRRAPGSLATTRVTVDWMGRFACDATELLAAAHGPPSGAEIVELYTGPFLANFDAGQGAEDFRMWAEQKRTELQAFALRLIEVLGREAEGRRDWATALRLGHRAVAVEAMFEEGHRRIMRAWSELGERAMALAHYQRYADWLRQDASTEPDLMTQELAATLRGPGPTEEVIGLRLFRPRPA